MGGELRTNDACMCVAKSTCCIPEAFTTLLTSYTPLQNKKFKKKKIDWLSDQVQSQFSGTRKVSFVLILFHLLIFLWLLVLIKIFIKTLAEQKLQNQEFRSHI